MNIAMTLRRFDLIPALLTSVGTDPEGDQLIIESAQRGLITDHVYRSAHPTDVYMAIEGANGLLLRSPTRMVWKKLVTRY